MKITLVSTLALGIVLSAPMFATSIVQVMPVAITASGTGFGYVSPDILVTGIQPFDSALGTLTSFELAWTLTLTGSATNDGEGYARIQGQANGAYFVGSSIWGGNSGSAIAGSDDAGPLNFSFDVNGSRLFQVSDAGAAYGQKILDLVTGPNPYPADWTSYTISTPVRTIPWTGGVDGNFTVTYNYEAAAPAAPEPGTFGLMSGVVLAGIAILRKRRGEPRP